MVHKSVASVFIGNKAKTFAVVKPLHSSLFHFFYLLIYKFKPQKVSTIKKGHKVKNLCGLINYKNF
jgi:hypothetical protein